MKDIPLMTEVPLNSAMGAATQGPQSSHTDVHTSYMLQVPGKLSPGGDLREEIWSHVMSDNVPLVPVDDKGITAPFANPYLE